MVMKGQYIRSIYNNRKYLTLGGAERIYCLMDIEKYFVGRPHTCAGKFSGTHHLYVLMGTENNSELGPLTPNGARIGKGLWS